MSYLYRCSFCWSWNKLALYSTLILSSKNIPIFQNPIIHCLRKEKLAEKRSARYRGMATCFGSIRKLRVVRPQKLGPFGTVNLFRCSISFPLRSAIGHASINHFPLILFRKHDNICLRKIPCTTTIYPPPPQIPRDYYRHNRNHLRLYICFFLLLPNQLYDPYDQSTIKSFCADLTLRSVYNIFHFSPVYSLNSRNLISLTISFRTSSTRKSPCGDNLRIDILAIFIP